MNESRIMRRILLACSRGDTRLFRNQMGAYKTSSGDFIRYGLCNPGGSDLIGHTTVTITPEMVGRRVCVFTSLECKAARGRLSAAQANWLEQVQAAGGIAGVAHSEDEARAIIAGWRAGP